MLPSLKKTKTLNLRQAVVLMVAAAMGADMRGAAAKGLGVAMVAQVSAAVVLGVKIWGATGVVVVKVVRVPVVRPIRARM